MSKQFKFTRKEFAQKKREYNLGMIDIYEWNRYYMRVVRHFYPNWVF